MENNKNYDELEDVLIKVKQRINKYYENMGRYGEVEEQEMEEVIADVDEILNNANLNKKKMILNRLEEED
jgi:hypothetical protein